jgi:pimeloyl-ACP methyl ester carboxylesterase
MAFASATHMHSANVDDLAQAVLALQDAVPEEFVRDFQAGTIHHGVPAEFLAGVVAESLKVPVHVWRAALEAQLAADFTGQVRRIGAPTLALWGDADTIFSAEARQALASGLPDAIVKVYPDTGHAPHWERPAEFVQDVLSFLRTGTA